MNVYLSTFVYNFHKKIHLDQGRQHITSKHGTEDIPHTSYDEDSYEVNSNEFKIYPNITLGSGEFGKVCQGKLNKRDSGAKYVAVKMMNPMNLKKIAINAMLSEIKMLSHVGQHENIIEMLGANTRNVEIGKIYIFLELCELGSLDKYLRKMRSRQVGHIEIEARIPTSDKIRIEPYVDVTKALTKNSLDESLFEDMHRWAREICNGMAYLASKQVVHADIAARNVLLNQNKVAKICDFGLSRRLYSYENCATKKQELLPWKWMSPESLRFLRFNEKSDIWAYGVTLWEIYALGEEPYSGIPWNLSFVDMLDDGMRLTEPKYNDENDMFSIMKQCWHANPQKRPTFAEILQTF